MKCYDWGVVYMSVCGTRTTGNRNRRNVGREKWVIEYAINEILTEREKTLSNTIVKRKGKLTDVL